jgi:GTPase SAR1 family protein
MENPTSNTAAHDPLEMRQYARLKGRLLTCIAAMSAVERACGDDCAELIEKIEANAFNLVVVGQFKRGKTCLINALLGDNVLPMSVVPLTSIVTILTYGDSLSTRVFFKDGHVLDIEPAELADYVTEQGNPENVKNVRDVWMTYPSSYLRNGSRLIDTPGVGSVYLHNTDAAYQYLPKSDAALFLLSVEQPVSKAELDFLKDVREHSNRIFFLINKIDYFSEKEVEESISFSRRVIKEAMGFDVNIFPVSAKLALDGKLEGSDELLRKSNLPAFSEVLNRFLMHEKGKVLLQSASNRLLRLLSQTRLAIDLEMQSLTIPVEEIKEKVELFQEKKKEILFDERNFTVLLESELARLKSSLDNDLAVLKERLAAQMTEQFDAFAEEHRDSPLKELDESIEEFVGNELMQSFPPWREKQDEKLSKEFQIICGRFAGEINDVVDKLMLFSSQLFGVPFERVEAEPLWIEESGFYYKLKEEQVGLDMLESSITHVLPRLVGNRFEKIKAFLFRMGRERILTKRKQQMLESVEMQSGRMRYDFLERLDRSKTRFVKEMTRKMDATIENIGAAVEKGLELRARGEKEAEERRSELASKWSRLEEIRNDIAEIRDSADLLAT